MVSQLASCREEVTGALPLRQVSIVHPNRPSNRYLTGTNLRWFLNEDLIAFFPLVFADLLQVLMLLEGIFLSCRKQPSLLNPKPIVCTQQLFFGERH